MAVGRDAKGRLKKGWRLTKSGVRKVTRKRTTRRRRRLL
jgi:hypothetical protein